MLSADTNTPRRLEQWNQPSAVNLQRIVRFAINPDSSTQGTNGFSSKPSLSGMARFYELTLACTGMPDCDTGYLVDIHAFDDVVRAHLIPVISRACETEPTSDPALLMPKLWELASEQLAHPLHSLTWSLSPYTRLTMNTQDAVANRVMIRQRYEFSASHRLHASSLDAETNRKIFGKCNNPNGHGHNYRVEPAISMPLDSMPINPGEIDHAVDNAILTPLDHKHLNVDCDAFNQDAGGMMPSVENIAKHCYEQLFPLIDELASGAQLAYVTVWETDRTSCTYPASGNIPD